MTSQLGAAPTVSNTGQCVPAEEVSALFEPFRWLIVGRTGYGGDARSEPVHSPFDHRRASVAQSDPAPGLIVEIDLLSASSAADH